MKLGNLAVLSALAACVALPTAALAEPVYLSCAYADGEYTEQIDFTLDEQAGTVTITNSGTGYAPKFKAGFAPDRVVFRDQLLKSYSISRTDLSFSITSTMGGAQTHNGKCKLKTAPKRAF